MSMYVFDGVNYAIEEEEEERVQWCKLCNGRRKRRRKTRHTAHHSPSTQLPQKAHLDITTSSLLHHTEQKNEEGMPEEKGQGR